MKSKLIALAALALVVLICRAENQSYYYVTHAGYQDVNGAYFLDPSFVGPAGITFYTNSLNNGSVLWFESPSGTNAFYSGRSGFVYEDDGNGWYVIPPGEGSPPVVTIRTL